MPPFTLPSAGAVSRIAIAIGHDPRCGSCRPDAFPTPYGHQNGRQQTSMSWRNFCRASAAYVQFKEKLAADRSRAGTPAGVEFPEILGLYCALCRSRHTMGPQMAGGIFGCHMLSYAVEPNRCHSCCALEASPVRGTSTPLADPSRVYKQGGNYSR